MFTNSSIPCLVLLLTICQCRIAQVTVGDNCTVTSTNLPGTCKITSDCPEQDKNGTGPTICGFHELTKTPIVCCQNENFVLPNKNLANAADFVFPDDEKESPSPDRRPTPSKSEQKCQEYTKNLTGVVHAIPLVYYTEEPLSINPVKCDHNGVALVVGGEPASAGEFPFMAAIGFFVDEIVEWSCGGTLVSDFYVLTAAHCTFSRDAGAPKIVRLGDLDLSSSDDNSVHADYNISNLIKHPDYRYPQQYNDIGLIQLSSKVKFTKYIRPACLHTSPDIDRTVVLAAGWGKSEFFGEPLYRLKKVSLHIHDNQICSKVYPKGYRLPQGINSSMVCAGEIKSGDTCQGDSGGPLFITKNGNQCKFYIVGVTSFGKACGVANAPGVYTRVSVFVPWIENTIWVILESHYSSQKNDNQCKFYIVGVTSFGKSCGEADKPGVYTRVSPCLSHGLRRLYGRFFSNSL